MLKFFLFVVLLVVVNPFSSSSSSSSYSSSSFSSSSSSSFSSSSSSFSPSFVSALEILSSSYKVVEPIVVDNDNKAEIALFTIEFSDDLYVNGRMINESIAEENPALPSPYLCFGPECRCLSPLINQLVGVADINLPFDYLRTQPPASHCQCHTDPDDIYCSNYVAKQQLSYMLALPTPIDSVASILGLLTGQATVDGIVFSSRSLTFVYMLSLLYDGIDYAAILGLRTNIFFPAIVDIQPWLTDSRGDPATTGLVVINDQFQLPACTFAEMQKISSYVEKKITLLTTSNTFQELNRFRWQLAGVVVADVFLRCQSDLLFPYLDGSIVQAASYPDTSCYYESDTPEFLADPCCNYQLSYQYCCAPRSQIFSYFEIQSVRSNAGENCRAPDEARLLFSDFIVSEALRYSTESGCAAAREKQANDALFKQLESFIPTCNTLLFGESQQGRACASDDDCYTSCFNSRCSLPYENMSTTFLSCYHDHFDPQLRSFLRAEWGLSETATKEEWIATMQFYWTTTNCFGATASSLVWSQDPANGNLLWEGTTEELCLADRVCNWNPSSPVETREECFIDGRDEGTSFCGYCNSDLCQELTKKPHCFKNTFDRQVCEDAGGRWDMLNYPYACVLDEFVTFDDCIPKSICPPPDSSFFQNQNGTALNAFIACDNRDLCILPNATQRNCFTDLDTWLCNPFFYEPLLIWEPSWRMGEGLCHALVPSRSDCDFLGGIWWTGRSYHTGYLDSRESCVNSGYCSLGGDIEPSLGASNCQSTQSCSGFCRKCRSRVPTAACVSSAPLTQCQCIIAGGLFIADSLATTCVFPLVTTSEECLARGYTFHQCESLTLEECQICNDTPSQCPIIQQILQCAVNVGERCETQGECIESGTCLDTELYNTVLPECLEYGSRSFVLASDCWGACVTAPLVDQYGRPFCGDEDESSNLGNFSGNPRQQQYGHRRIEDYSSSTVIEQSVAGCIHRRYDSPSECALAGPDFRWIPIAATKEECLREESCRESEFLPFYKISYFSPKSDEDCISCLGRPQSTFVFEDSSWVNGKLTKGVWRPYDQVSVNTWGDAINYTKVFADVENLIVQIWSSAYQSEALCNIYGRLSTTIILACDCLYNPDVPSTCYGNLTVPGGSFKFCHGIENNLRVSLVDVLVSAGSVDVDDICLAVNISLVSVQQYRKELVNSMSADQLSSIGKSSKHKDNQWAVLLNGERVIGQLVSDGIQFKFDDKAANFTDVTICVDTRSDVSVDSKSFEYPDFAYDEGNTGVFVIMAAPTRVVRSASTNVLQYCTSLPVVKSGVYYLPIARVEDYWRGKNNQTSFYVLIVALADLTTAFLAIWRLLSFYMSMQLKMSKTNVQVFLFGMIALFMLVRSIYLFLVYVGKDFVDDIDVVALYLLYDLPLLLYFSAYSILIFYWAEISTSLSQTAVIQRLLRPCLICNASLYAVFFALIVAFYNFGYSEEFLFAYRIFLAVVSLIASIAFFFFGNKLSMRIQESYRFSQQSIAVVTAPTSSLGDSDRPLLAEDSVYLSAATSFPSSFLSSPTMTTDASFHPDSSSINSSAISAGLSTPVKSAVGSLRSSLGASASTNVGTSSPAKTSPAGKRIYSVTAIVSAAFLIQCVYLAATAFTSITKVSLALIPFILSELLPCLCVIFVLKPPLSAKTMVGLIIKYFRDTISGGSSASLTSTTSSSSRPGTGAYSSHK